MPASRRLFDIVLSLAALATAVPFITLCAALILCIDRQTPIFGARRMSLGQPFTMWKLRTMRGLDDGLPTGGSKAQLITPLGRVLRRFRIDELPQLWNVVKGDMCLIGPRPHTPMMKGHYQSWGLMKPGLVGLGTVRLAERERRLLSEATTPGQIKAIYATQVLPRKLRLDQFHAENHSVAFDLWIGVEAFHLILFGTDAGSRLRLHSLRRKCGRIVSGLRQIRRSTKTIVLVRNRIPAKYGKNLGATPYF